MPIILEITSKIFLLKNFSDLTVIKKKPRVISNTNNMAMALYMLYMYPWLMLEVTMTEVMDAGPANKGIAKGHTEL